MAAQTAAGTQADTTAGVKAAPVVEQGVEYVVFERRDDELWRNVGKVTARAITEAIDKYATANGNTGGTFAAVPASRWKPVKATPQTVTTLKLEAAN
jgi:hypothetical protein